jgi:hypothetical protein
LRAPPLEERSVFSPLVLRALLLAERLVPWRHPF